MTTWPTYMCGYNQVCVERRNAQGVLEFTGEQPPRPSMTPDELFKLFWRDNPEGVCGPEQFFAWLRSKGWSVRAKYW